MLLRTSRCLPSLRLLLLLLDLRVELRIAYLDKDLLHSFSLGKFVTVVPSDLSALSGVSTDVATVRRYPLDAYCKRRHFDHFNKVELSVLQGYSPNC